MPLSYGACTIRVIITICANLSLVKVNRNGLFKATKDPKSHWGSYIGF